MRLCKRYRRLIARGKHPNVAVTAIARELAAFMWAIAKGGPYHRLASQKPLQVGKSAAPVRHNPRVRYGAAVADPRA